MKKTLLVIFLVGFVLIIISGLIFAKKINHSNLKTSPTAIPEQKTTEILSEKSLDIKLEPRFDKKAVIITASGLLEKGFTEFEYEISYDTEDGLTQGSFSKEPIKVTAEEFKREILLGTCSKNVCKYDRGVNSVRLTFRLKDKQGNIKIWQKEFNIE